MLKTKDSEQVAHTHLECNNLKIEEMFQERNELIGPFAGVSVCHSGDPMQLKCVGGESIPMGMVKTLLHNEKEFSKHVPLPNKPTDAGRRILRMFSKVELTNLFRAEDPKLRDILLQWRNQLEYHPIKMETLKSIPILTRDDINENNMLRFARIAVTSNSERHYLLPIVLEQHRILTGQRVLFWRKPFNNVQVVGSDLEKWLYKDKLYGKELKQYFQRGAFLETSTSTSNDSHEGITGLAMLLHNICPTMNLVNGTVASLFGIVYNDENVQRVQESRISNGTDELEIPIPDYVLIELDKKQAKDWPKTFTCVPGKYVFPIKVGMSDVLKHYLRLPSVATDNRPKNLEYLQFDYEMAAITTAHKLQVCSIIT
jgi:hypothetical protein